MGFCGRTKAGQIGIGGQRITRSSDERNSPAASTLYDHEFESQPTQPSPVLNKVGTGTYRNVKKKKKKKIFKGDLPLKWLSRVAWPVQTILHSSHAKLPKTKHKKEA